MLFRLFTVFAVAALAISTWILSSPSHRAGPKVDGSKAELPGYYLKNAILTDYDVSGAPTIRVDADRIDQVDHGTEVALFVVKVHYQAPNGQNWLLTGDTGRVESGGKQIDMTGNVRLRSEGTDAEGTAVILSDTLTYDVPESIVSTKSDVRLDYGAHTLTARGLVANLKDHTIHLDSKVNGRFQR